jgi:hypothetical protein
MNPVGILKESADFPGFMNSLVTSVPLKIQKLSDNDENRLNHLIARHCPTVVSNSDRPFASALP